MSGASQNEVWASGAPYEAYVGRWSRLVAHKFLEWLRIPPNLDWLDVGSGTGAITQTILDVSSPHSVKGIDRSDGFVQYAQTFVTDPRAGFEAGDAQALPLPDASVDVAISGLVLNFVPQPERMAAEMARVTRPGGWVGVYVWDYAEQMQMMRYFWNAVAVLDPANKHLDEGRRFPICNPERLAELFTAAGLRQVEARGVTVTTRYANFEDYWTPFLGGQGPAPTYIAALGEARRNGLRDYIQSRLPIQADGSIPLVARAWAVRGQVAG